MSKRYRLEGELAFGEEDCGCHADGTFGHSHVRARLGELVEAIAGPYVSDETKELIVSLRVPPPDDAWDEEEAIDMLNTLTEEGFSWGFADGDLVLSPELWGA